MFDGLKAYFDLKFSNNLFLINRCMKIKIPLIFVDQIEKNKKNDPWMIVLFKIG